MVYDSAFPTVTVTAAVSLAVLAADTVESRSHPAPPHQCSIELEQIATLGALDDPSSITVSASVDVARAPWGGWIVTEDGNNVIEYDADGAFRGFFGTRGEGPEELNHPTTVAVDPTDSVWISDNRGRVVVFDPTGAPSRTVLHRDVYEVQGFTPSGLPFGVLALGAPSPSGHQAWEYAQVWNRNGENLYRLGPAAVDPTARGATTNQPGSCSNGVM